MKTKDIEVLMGSIGPVIKEFVEASLLPVAKEIEDLKKRFQHSQRARTQKIDEKFLAEKVRSQLLAEIDSRIECAVSSLPKPEPVTAERMKPVLEEMVTAAVARIGKHQSAEPQLGSLMIDFRGDLIAETQCGWTRNLGRVAAPASTRRDDTEIEDAIEVGLMALPAPHKQLIAEGV